ncbi:MAG: hypothetical protein M3N05_07085 [Pseudomonadota bacterium]|nr:hypothetical protein [Pseudomonadota bacterium]
MTLAALLIVLLLAAASDTPTQGAIARFSAGLKRRLPKSTGGRLALAIAAILVAVALFQILKTEAFGIAGAAAPELATWLALLDVGTAVDLFAVAILAALTVRFREVSNTLRSLGAHVVRLWRHGRQSRRRSVRRRSGKEAEDGEPWGAAPAFG